ncbi:MAG: heparinase II/III domain-containing protein, partial [Verrucomicrobiia bacterium]
YNASVKGHNTITFGGREQRFPIRQRGEVILSKEISGRQEQWWHEPGQGTAWSMELAPAYTGVKHFKRTVLHLWPGFILVLDDAEVEKTESISLRWHTINTVKPTASGSFLVRAGGAAAMGRIINLADGDMQLEQHQHAYTAPYDRDRTGTLLDERNESYVEAKITAKRCRFLTLFATGADDDFDGSVQWNQTPTGWTFYGLDGPVTATVEGSKVSLRAPQTRRKVELTI